MLRADATRLPFPDASIDAIVADLPFGMLIGSPRENVVLYPAMLEEAARVAGDGAPFVAITASRGLFKSALEPAPRRWDLIREIPVKIPFRSGYLRPVIFVLRRTPATIAVR